AKPCAVSARSFFRNHARKFFGASSPTRVQTRCAVRPILLLTMCLLTTVACGGRSQLGDDAGSYGGSAVASGGADFGGPGAGKGGHAGAQAAGGGHAGAQAAGGRAG